jgi:insulin receptor
VYIRSNDKPNGADLPKSGRSKRQIHDLEFPSENPSDATAFVVAALDRELLKNSSDFYADDIGPDNVSFVIPGLSHYTTYTIRIRACRKREDGESHSAEICGPEMKDFAVTFKEPANDNVPKFEAESVVNGSLTDIRVSWEQPTSPNGLLLTYTIRYKRVDIEHTQPVLRCISQAMLNGSNQYVLKGLPAGNYSIDVMATSMAGNGNFTRAKFVLIKEQNTMNMLWMAVAVMAALFVVGIVALIVTARRMNLSNISSMKLIANVNPDYAGVTYRQDEWEIPRDRIIQLQELGCGSFGEFFFDVWCTQRKNIIISL